MFVLGSEITINGIRFSRVSEVKIESSLKVLEDIATMELPTTALLKRSEDDITEVETAKQFKKGDEVVIKLGYDGNLNEEFRGFVSKIKPYDPLVIECEDATYLLKRKKLKRTFRAVKLKELISFIIEGTGIEIHGQVPEINFNKFIFKNTNGAKALQKIKEEYGLTIYFKEFKKLFIGLASDDDGVKVNYVIGQNVIDNKLEWQDEEDVSLQIKAILVKPDNTRIEKTIGDDDGETRTLFFYNLENKADLEKRALEEILKYKYAGFKGSFITFLLPIIRPGNIASLKDEVYDFEERDANYLAEKVLVTFGDGGGRREIFPGLKLS